MARIRAHSGQDTHRHACERVTRCKSVTVGDWLQIEVRGLGKPSIDLPQGAETLSAVGRGGFLLKNLRGNRMAREVRLWKAFRKMCEEAEQEDQSIRKFRGFKLGIEYQKRIQKDALASHGAAVAICKPVNA